jgi:hypothetical protein
VTSTANGRNPSQSTLRPQRPRSTPKKAGNRAPSPSFWQRRLHFQPRVGQSRFFGCPEFRTTGVRDFRALRKERPRRRTIDRHFHFRLFSCLQPCCGDPKRCCGCGNYAPSPSKAARTILTASNQVKIASQPYKSLIQLDLSQRLRTRHGAVAALQQLRLRLANSVAVLWRILANS